MKAPRSIPHFSRRDFLKSAGCLTIGFSLFSPEWLTAGELPLEDTLPGSLQHQPRINAWLEILEDSRVRVLTGKMELGQGIRTAIAQVAAEELDMDLDRIEVHLAETERTPHEGYTAGSGSIENSAMSVRYAAAAARQKLLELAAQRLKKKVDQLNVADGKVSTKDGKDQLTFAEILNGAQIEEEVRLPVALKPKNSYRWVGKAIPRKDIERMVRGEPVYVQDLRFPGMVHARVVRPSGYQAHLVKFDREQLKKKFPGLLKTVVNGDFVGIIAAEEYFAVQAQLFLKEHIQWSSTVKLPEGQSLAEYIKNLPGKMERVKEPADQGISEKPGSTTLQATYSKPYVMHGSIGPSCAVALYENEKLHIWSHSQGIYPMRESLVKMLGLKATQIHIVGVPGSGCYGHNGADDAAADTALLAMAYPGKHVRLQWSREEEHGWEPYGSAMRMELEASLDSTGKINNWHCEVWTDSHSTRPGAEAGNLLAARYLEKPFRMESAGYLGGGHRNTEPYYTIPHLNINAHFFEGPLRVSSLRSLGAYANIFAIESFVDELAEKAGREAIEFRLAHLDDARAVSVVKKVQELIKDQKAAKNEGVGFAFSRYKNTATYCAVAARVAVDNKTGDVQVLRMWAAIDAGEVINLDGIINQTEGAMIQSASWTLKEEVLFDEQHVRSLDWATYPIFRFSDVPQVEVAVINRPEEKPLGAGEAAQGPAAAAIANAIYRACGKRVRQLPIRPEKLIG